MSEDFKALWQQQQVADIPDVRDIMKRAAKMKNKTRNKTLLSFIALILAFAYYIFYLVHNPHILITTEIGTFLILIAIIFHQVASVSILPMLLKSDAGCNSKEYLDILIKLKRKQDFYYKRILNITMFILATGLLLYTGEVTQLASLGWIIAVYVFVSGWMIFMWAYIRPRKWKKHSTALNEVIHHLENLDKQITSTE